MVKGQASMEYLIITAVLLVILSSIIITSLGHLNSLKETVALKNAKLFVNTVCDEIDYVSSYSKGSVTNTKVSIPQGYFSNLSYIENEMVNLKVYDSDINTKCSMKMIGELPDKKGKYNLKIVNRGDKVELAFS